MTPDPFAGAGVTALGLAAARAVETSRPDRLIDDPCARRLFEAAGRDLPMRLEWPADPATVSDTEALHLHGSRYVGLRTRHYDDVLVAAADAGARQAVLLGAGLDTRALRLPLPSDLTLYELDAPAVLEFKAGVLAGEPPRCRLERVGTDLAGSWRGDLLRAGFRPGASTAWIAEGLMPYLPGPAQTALVDVVSSCSEAATTLDLDQVAGGDVRELSARSGLDMRALLVSTDGAGRLESDLASRGWGAETVGVQQLAASYGRDLADPFSAATAEPPWLETVFVRARR